VDNLFYARIQKGPQAVKDIMRGDEPAVTRHRDNSRHPRKRVITRCSICERRTWFNTIRLIEPEEVPDPRQQWILCQRCHQALLVQMRLSPIRNPLRLRIAIGLVASERSPYVYAPTRKPLSDRTWIIIMAWGFGIAMVLHLILIVMLAFVAGH
jgi:hypothetical protein